jgi:hypothetical protein
MDKKICPFMSNPQTATPCRRDCALVDISEDEFGNELLSCSAAGIGNELGSIAYILKLAFNV